jgi:hypothetical protein
MASRGTYGAAVALVCTGLAAAAVGCGGDGGARTGEVSAARASFAPSECGTYSGKGCAPDSERVDLARPSFSHPTNVVNPLFPISNLRSVVLLGREGGRPFRSETTLLPQTTTVEWDGQRIEALLSQYVAFRDGRIEEAALDRYAQADDGSVWYLGEDVVDYRNGTVATTEGTWMAGKEGPPAMIMPAQPKVGDVFRTENVPGIVFEQVTVKRVGKTVQGPNGPVAGAIVGEELHLDETHEDKTFAPGYGEFFTGAGADVEALALAAPTDHLSTPPSPRLASLATSASGMLGSVQTRDWAAATATRRRMKAAWRGLRRQQQPKLVAGRLSGALARRERAVRRHKATRAAQASIDAGQSVLDLQLRHRAPADVDRDRFELWCHQILVDAAVGDSAGVRGDVATLEWIRDRITDTFEPPALADVDARLRALRAAADGREVAAAADHAARLIGRLRRT